VKVAAIIPAAGKGKRIGMGINKPYLLLGNKPILVHTLETFEKCDFIEEVIVVVNRTDKERCQRILKKHGLRKVKEIVSGGAKRSHSVYRGLKKVNSSCGIVVIHDGVRPFLTRQMIRKSVEGAKKYGACAVGMPAIDTIKKVSGGGFVEKTPERKKLWFIQTPQTFKYKLLLKAYLKAKKNGFEGTTDDSFLVERMGYKVKLIRGSYDNLKITTPQDLVTARAILKRGK
jgi:2-C-methyl-D-erythritol 4-phosphate cytidylyltransferase